MIIRNSMIDTYIQCKRKFHEIYIQGRTEKQTSSALAFGSAMHAALASWAQGDDPFSTFSIYWDSVKAQNLEYDRYSWSDLNELALESFLPKWMKLHAKKFKNIQSEETLTSPLFDGHILQGTYDAVTDYEGELTLIDYKTSASRYYQNQIERGFQLYIYAYLYTMKYGVMPKAIMYKVFIKSEKSVQTLSIPLTKSKLDEQMGKVTIIIKDIVRLLEEPKANWYCNPKCYCINPASCWG